MNDITMTYTRPPALIKAFEILKQMKDSSAIPQLDLDVSNILEWQDLNDIGLANKGVKMMSMGSDCNNNQNVIVYFPKNSEVHIHYHKEENEEITTLLGEIHYKIYDNNNTLLREGLIKRFEQLLIAAGDKHLVFTTNKESFVMITFIKNLKK